MAIVTVKVPDGPECRSRGHWGSCKFIKTRPVKGSNGVCILYDQDIEFLGSCNNSLGRAYAKCKSCLDRTIKED